MLIYDYWLIALYAVTLWAPISRVLNFLSQLALAFYDPGGLTHGKTIHKIAEMKLSPDWYGLIFFLWFMHVMAGGNLFFSWNHTL